jgi:hypothetical protein
MVPMTTYYVDPSSGSDNNSGLSPASAWQSIARIPTAILQPGDSVLFKAGSVFREPLVITASGTHDQPITVGAYGSGDKPLFKGSVELHDATWTETSPGSNVWTTPVAAVPVADDPSIIFFNGASATRSQRAPPRWMPRATGTGTAVCSRSIPPVRRRPTSGPSSCRSRRPASSW